MRGTIKMRPGRQLQMLASGESGGGFLPREEISVLKARRNKKNVTAAQAQGKVTGRWTEEEHERFNEGKCIFKSFSDLDYCKFIIRALFIIRLLRIRNLISYFISHLPPEIFCDSSFRYTPQLLLELLCSGNFLLKFIPTDWRFSIYFARILTRDFFLLAIRLFGKNWKKVTNHVRTRISA